MPNSSHPLSRGFRTGQLQVPSHLSWRVKARTQGKDSGQGASSKPSNPRALRPLPNAHVHDCINLGNSFIIRGKLVDLDPIADQFTHDLDLELVELTLGDGVSFGNDGNNVHLPGLWRGSGVSCSPTVDSPSQVTPLGRGAGSQRDGAAPKAPQWSPSLNPVRWDHSDRS